MKRESGKYEVRRLKEYMTKYLMGKEFYGLAIQDMKNIHKEDFVIALEEMQFNEEIYTQALVKLKEEKKKHIQELKNIETKIFANKKLKGQKKIPF